MPSKPSKRPPNTCKTMIPQTLPYPSLLSHFELLHISGSHEECLVILTAIVSMAFVSLWMAIQGSMCYKARRLEWFIYLKGVTAEDWLKDFPVRKRRSFLPKWLFFGKRKLRLALVKAVIHDNRVKRHEAIAPKHDFRCAYCVFTHSCKYKYFETCNLCLNSAGCNEFLSCQEKKRICADFSCKFHIETD